MSPRSRASAAAKKEVEANPFKKLIDISDLIEFEANPSEVEKEVQNIMLRYNSEFKSWYRLYSRKIEATKSEESFAMTLRQVWRFLRDCQFVNHDSTLATFDRIFNHGKKNHFTLLGTGEVAKFNLMYGIHGDDGPTHINELLQSANKEDDFIEEEERDSKDESTEDCDLATRLGIEPENVHGATRVVL